MFFALKPDCYYRRYGNVGYLARPIIGIEEVVDEIGAIFLEPLKYFPQSMEDIVPEICSRFNEVNLKVLEEDALEFYMKLVEAGFLTASDTLENFQNEGFRYSTLKGRQAYNQFHVEGAESSAIFLSEYSKEYPFLQTLHIELTSKCNERCLHCYIPHEKKDTDIDRDLMMDVLEQSKEIGVMTIVFSGGEPMLHPHFKEFLKKAKDLDFNVTVLTNLTLLDDEIIEVLKYKHVACVNVSLYSMDADIHDVITTVRGSFSITKSNILRLIDNNIPVQINCPVMQQNKDSFHHVIRWGHDHKCAVITDYVIMARSDCTTDNLKHRLLTDDIHNVIEKIAENNVAFQTNLLEDTPDEIKKLFSAEEEDRVCGVGLSTICMVANGDVYPCAGWQQYVCGNVNSIPLEKIWNESYEINCLRKLRLKDFTQCVGCVDHAYCLMCISRNYNESSKGSLFDVPLITCEAARIHHEIADEFREKLISNQI